MLYLIIVTDHFTTRIPVSTLQTVPEKVPDLDPVSGYQPPGSWTTGRVIMTGRANIPGIR